MMARTRYRSRTDDAFLLDEREREERLLISLVFSTDYLYLHLQHRLEQLNLGLRNVRLIFHSAEELWRRGYAPDKPLVVIAQVHLMALKVYDFPVLSPKSPNYDEVMEFITRLLVMSVICTPPDFPASLPSGQ